jgi:hypothetical protein
MEALHDLLALVANPRARGVFATLASFLVKEQNDDQELFRSQGMPALFAKVAKFYENNPLRTAEVIALEDCLVDCVIIASIKPALHGVNFRKWDMEGIHTDVAKWVNIDDLRRLNKEQWQTEVKYYQSRGDHLSWKETAQRMIKPAKASAVRVATIWREREREKESERDKLN